MTTRYLQLKLARHSRHTLTPTFPSAIQWVLRISLSLHSHTKLPPLTPAGCASAFSVAGRTWLKCWRCRQRNMATVTVEDLANEILRHHSSPQILHLLDGLRSRNIDLREFCSRVRQLLGADVLIRTVNGLKQSRARAHPSMAVPSAPSAPAARFAPAAPSLRSSLPPPAASAQTIKQEYKQEYNQVVPLTGTTPVPPASMLGQSAASSWQGEGSGASSASKAKGSNLGTKVLIHALLCPKVRSAAPARDDIIARPPARARALARTHGGTISHALSSANCTRCGVCSHTALSRGAP